MAGSLILPLKELQAKINQELDPVLVGESSKKGGKKSLLPFRIIRSGPVHIQYVKQQIRFSAPLQLQLTKLFGANANTAGQKPFCAIRVNFSSPLTITPAWRLASHITFIDYSWEIKPEIKLLGKTISLASFGERVIAKYQVTIENALDSAVYRNLRLDKLVSPIWQNIQKPLSLTKQYGLWLLPKPISVAASPISGDAQKLTIPLLITLQAQTEISPQKPVYPPKALPPLQKRDSLPQRADLRVTSFVPYAEINRVAAQLIHNKPVSLFFGKLTIVRASVYGGQRAIIVKADVRGLVDGTIYLRGRPVFDTTTNTLRVANLDFDAQTQSALSQITRGMLKRGLSDVLEKVLTVPLGDAISQLPQTIDKAFEKSEAGKKVNLGIKAFLLVPQRIAVRPDGIQTLIHVQSTVAVDVQHL